MNLSTTSIWKKILILIPFGFVVSLVVTLVSNLVTQNDDLLSGLVPISIGTVVSAIFVSFVPKNKKDK